MANSIANTTNMMRRAVAALLQRPPTKTDRQRALKHFDGSCAYCGRALQPGWHLDHLVAAGGDHLGNRVPACPPCNGNEKRDMAWEAFLALKASGPEHQLRRERILGWQQGNGAPSARSSAEVEALRRELDELTNTFAVKCRSLRDAVRSSES